MDGRPVSFKNNQWIYDLSPSNSPPHEEQEKQDFNQWFATFIEEKGLLNLVIEIEDKHGWNYVPIEVIQEYLQFCNEKVQEKVKTKLVQLDFCNMSISHFLEYIAKGIDQDF